MLLACGERLEASSVGDQYFYYYADQQRFLTLDIDHLAVLMADGADQIGNLPIAGWSLVEIPEASRSAQGVQALVQQLSGQPAFEFASPVFFDSFGGPLIVTHDILVRFHAEVPGLLAEAILALMDSGIILEANWSNMQGAFRVRSASHNGFEVLEAANALAELAEIKWAEPDMMFTGRSHLIPDDTFFDDLWGIHNTGQTGGTDDMDMDGPQAWNMTTGSNAIHVVIIDSGTQLNHPDLNVQTGTDTTSDASTDGSPVNMCDNHGTWVAGCVSAIINNNLGVVGIAPDCVSRPARTFISNVPCDGNWTTCASWTVDTLDWAESNGVRVSNNSNSYGFMSNCIADKYADTRTNGMVHFASAGNDSDTNINYPSSLASVNSIAAVNDDGNLASFSDSGTGLAFTAPGDDIWTTDRTGSDGGSNSDYALVDGTSFASPYAAGVAALVLSVDDLLGAAEVEQIMQDTARDLGAPGYDTTFGWGLVNANQALLGTVGAHLDVKPGSCPNPINRNSNGVIPIALIGTASFNVANVNLPTVRLWRADGAGEGVAPNEGPPGPHTVIADVATPFDGDTCECDELAGDGIPDLSMKFRTQDVVGGLQLNDLDMGEMVGFMLTGNMLDGTPFGAIDCITLVPPGSLAVSSNLAGLWVDVSPDDDDSQGGGFTPFNRVFPQTESVTITPLVPGAFPGWSLLGWVVDGVFVPASGETLEFPIDADTQSVAVWYHMLSDLDIAPGEGSRSTD